MFFLNSSSALFRAIVSAKGAVIEDGESFSEPDVRQRLMPLYRSLSPKTCVTDGRSFVAYLDKQASVDTTRKIGTTGYCMTGSYTMRLAAALPGVVASHTDKPVIGVPVKVALDSRL